MMWGEARQRLKLRQLELQLRSSARRVSARPRCFGVRRLVTLSSHSAARSSSLSVSHAQASTRLRWTPSPRASAMP